VTGAPEDPALTTAGEPEPPVSTPVSSGALPVNRISPVRFIVGFGIVSALADIVYEGARSIIGPYLGSLGATAAVVGAITGAGEAAALVLRLFTGRLSDRTGRPWPQTIAGYALTAICVPLIALTGNLAAAGRPHRCRKIRSCGWKRGYRNSSGSTRRSPPRPCSASPPGPSSRFTSPPSI
jgi:hypothetical protein